jgi:hypothetical protein
LLGTVLSVCTFWFHNIVTLHSRFVSTDFGTWSCQCSLSNFTPISLHMLKCSWTHALSHVSSCTFFATIGNAVMMCSTVSSYRLQCLNLLSVSVCNIFVAWYLVCNAWFCAAIISLSVSPFRFPLYSHRTCLLHQ